MARGQSGRIVLEIDPVIKRAIHSRLVAEGRTLKDWFLEQARDYLDPRQQVLPLGEYGARPEPPLLKVAETKTPYSRRSR